jgi:hypothetical protein
VQDLSRKLTSLLVAARMERSLIGFVVLLLSRQLLMTEWMLSDIDIDSWRCLGGFVQRYVLIRCLGHRKTLAFDAQPFQASPLPNALVLWSLSKNPGMICHGSIVSENVHWNLPFGHYLPLADHVPQPMLLPMQESHVSVGGFFF